MRKLFKLIIAVFGLYELHEFNLVELMLTDKTPCIPARTARFAAETCTVSAIFDGKLLTVQNIAAVNVCNGNLCRRDKEVVRACNLECIILKLRELTRSRHGSSVDHIGRKNLRIAVFGMYIKIIVYKCTLKPCTESAIDREPCTRYLARIRKIKNVQRLAEIPMCFRFKIKLCRFSEPAYLRIVAIIRTVGNAGMRDIRNFHQKVVKLCVDLRKLRIKLLDIIRNKLHFRKQCGNILSLLFKHGNLCGIFITFRLELFCLLNYFAAFFVQFENAADIRPLVAARFHCSNKLLRILSDSLNI